MIIRLKAYFGQHGQALVGALGRLYRTLVPSIMTAAVIGIALALPGGFLVLLDNIKAVTGSWDGTARISVFLDKRGDLSRYRQLADTLSRDQAVASVELVTPAAALAEVQEGLGLSDALDLLDDNPLPPVLVVQPAPNLEPLQTDQLVSRLKSRPEAQQVRLDWQWVQRLYAIMQLIQRGIWVVTGLLAVAVMLVVGNTIRLAIQNRRDEIVVTKLIGATDAFIRRPFLYEGAWYGLIGAILAIILLEIGLLILAGPARELAMLYGSGYRIIGLGFDGAWTLVLAGVMLGWLGSWLAVGRHLAAIEPT